jgi:hypothetical protein
MTFLKHRVTTILGGVIAVAQVLHSYGISIGHFGQADILQLISALALGALGVYAADANKVVSSR